MPRKRKRPAESSSKGSRSAARNRKRPDASVSRHDTFRKNEFELVRLRRQGLNWKDAERQSGTTRRIAERLLPRAFFKDKRGRLQVRAYDPYSRRLRIHTKRRGEFRWLRARGSRKASLVAKWNNAVKAAGRGDFSLIDAYPRNVFIDGVRLPILILTFNADQLQDKWLENRKLTIVPRVSMALSATRTLKL